MGRMKSSCDRWASAEVWLQMDAYCADKGGNATLILMCCTLIFPIHIYMFSLSAPFLYLHFFSPSYHFHFYLQLFACSFSAYLSFAFASLSLFMAQIIPARLESLYSSQDREEIRSIKSFCGTPPPAKRTEMIKSRCSGLQQIPTCSPVQFTLFTIRQNLLEVLCFPCALPGGDGEKETLWVWVANVRPKHSVVLPLSHFLPNNPWSTEQLVFPFLSNFFQLPTWLLLSRGRLSGLEPGSWLVTCFPVAREEFPEDEWYAGCSQGTGGLPNLTSKLGQERPHICFHQRKGMLVETGSSGAYLTLLLSSSHPQPPARHWGCAVTRAVIVREGETGYCCSLEHLREGKGTQQLPK